jgi:hypothetical protein
MATYVNELLRRDGQLQQKEGYSFTRSFIVVTETAMTESQVIALSGIPQLYERLTVGSLYAVKSIKATQTGQDNRTWEVTVNYSTIEGGDEGGSDDPTEEPARLRFGNEPVEEAVRKCFGRTKMGVAFDPTLIGVDPTAPAFGVLNSHGDEFDPPVMGRRYNSIISITRNERLTAAQISDLQDYNGCLNSQEVSVAGRKILPFQGLIRDIGMERAYDQRGRRYWIVSYEIVVDPTRHSVKALDAGFVYYETGGDLQFREPDSDQPATMPGKLNGHGGKLGSTTSTNNDFEAAAPTTSLTPVYLEFLTIFPRDWSPLRLPDAPSDRYS